MVLILEVLGPQGAQLGSACRMVFGSEGGLIGRDSRNSWVLPHSKVSGRHARIFCQNGIFYIEDTSTNGVFMNGSSSRVGKGRSYALTSGDTILIDPYRIGVTVSSSDQVEPRARRSSPAPPPGPARSPLLDPFGGADPFAEQGVPFGDQIVPASYDPQSEPLAGQEVDPLKLLGGEPPARRAAPRTPLSAQDLERSSPLQGHYQPPRVLTPTPPPTPSPEPPRGPENPFAIPEDYDPLAPATKYRVDPAPVRRAGPPPPAPPSGRHPPEPAQPADPFDFDTPLEPLKPSPAIPEDFLDLESAKLTAPPTPVAAAPSLDTPPPIAPPPAPPPDARGSSPNVAPPRPEPVPPPRPEPTPPPADPPPSVPASAVASAADAFPIDLRGVLEGAGLDPEDVTPELAENFGKILRVVVGGLMEVLQARHSVKDEFRMRVTQFRQVDNNPLKFSANVDDALHNLLVKRNAAYLKPVEAFDDAFDDLRHHQLAMLAGMRTAFEAMLNEFQPDRLEDQFDRQLKRSALLGVATKLRYWDLYRDLHEEFAKDSEVTFRRVFGDAFAKAYEEQLQRLKAQASRAIPGNPPDDPDR